MCEVPAGRLDLRFGAGRFVSLYRWGTEVPPTRTLDLGPLKLRLGNSVLGWVETETGESAADTRIVLSPLALRRQRDEVSRARMERLEHTAQANDRGFFHIDGVRHGKYVIEAQKQPFAPARATVEVVTGEETIIANPSLMLKKPISLEVYVNPPVPPLGEEWLIEVKQVDQQSQTIGVLDQGAVSAGGFWSHPAVPPGSYWLRITTEDGSSWFAEDAEPEVTERTNDKGACHIAGAPPGLATVSAGIEWNGKRWSSEELMINLTADDETRRAKLVLQPETRIRGRIVADGLGIPGARLKAEPVNLQGLLVPLQVTDAEGNFETFVSFYTREFFLSVAAPGFAFRFLRLPVDPDVPLVIPVSREGGTLVVDLPPWHSSAGRDVPLVFLYHEGGRESMWYLRSWERFSEQSQEEGNTYLIPRMEPGEYTVCLTHPSNSVPLPSAPGPGDLCAGGYLPAFGELHLSLTGGPVREFGSLR